MQKRPAMTREQTEDAIALQEVRVQRLLDGDKGVDDEDFDEFPLFTANSTMFYHCMPSGEQDFPHYEERLEAWHVLNETSMNATTTGAPGSAAVVQPPIMYNFPKMLLLMMTEEHNWRAQQRFIDLVMKNHDRHVIGYWPGGNGQERTLDTLCVYSAHAVMLTPKPDRANNCHHHLGSLAAPAKDSSIRQLHADIQKKGVADFTTVYMMYCEPHHMEMVSLLFPGARIVAITTPMNPHFEMLMLEVLRARLTMPNEWTVDQKIAYLNKLPAKVMKELKDREEARNNGRANSGKKNKVANNK